MPPVQVRAPPLKVQQTVPNELSQVGDQFEPKPLQDGVPPLAHTTVEPEQLTWAIAFASPKISIKRIKIFK